MALFKGGQGMLEGLRPKLMIQGDIWRSGRCQKSGIRVFKVGILRYPECLVSGHFVRAGFCEMKHANMWMWRFTKASRDSRLSCPKLEHLSGSREDQQVFVVVFKNLRHPASKELNSKTLNPAQEN